MKVCPLFIHYCSVIHLLICVVDKSTGGDLGIRRRKQPSSSSDNTLPAKKLSAVEKNRLARANRGNIERVTEVADRLIATGLTGLYSMSYEAIYASTVLWEYKGHDGVIHGPFTSQQISGWKAQGYLTGTTAVSIRQVRRPHLSSATANSKSAGKQVRFEAKKEMSIYDDDDIDSNNTRQQQQQAAQSTLFGDSSGAAKLAEIASLSSANVVEVSAQAQVAADEGWMNSDDIDFGEYIDLNRDLMMEETSRKRSSHSSSKNIARSQQQGSRETMANDDDGEEEEEEMGKLQSSKQRKRKYNADADSADGEDEDD